MARPLEPLRFHRHPVSTVWGGTALSERFGLEEKNVGETWEIVDREKENSVVEGGPFAGLKLEELMRTRGNEILGNVPAAKKGRFPLLVKYIDAAQNLSVQVHPDEDAAQRHGGSAEAKTEAWWVLDVAANARIFAGVKPGTDPEEFRRKATTKEVVPMLASYSADPGDCFLLEGGTVHAIGAGVTILEVQQNSNTTYRLYDWERARETHVDRALDSMHFEREARPVRTEWRAAGEGLEHCELARSHVFRMDRLRVTGHAQRTACDGFRIYTVLAGAGAIRVGDERWPLASGDVWLVPASFGAHGLEANSDGLDLIESTGVTPGS